MEIKVIKGDITKLDTDAIVNAANKELRGGSGVCGAIFRASGHYDELQKERYKKGSIKTGEATITSGYDLKAKYGIDYLYEELKKIDIKSYENIPKNNEKRVMRAIEFYKLHNSPISVYNEIEKSNNKKTRFNLVFFMPLFFLFLDAIFIFCIPI